MFLQDSIITTVGQVSERRRGRRKKKTNVSKKGEYWKLEEKCKRDSHSFSSMREEKPVNGFAFDPFGVCQGFEVAIVVIFTAPPLSGGATVLAYLAI